MQQAALRGLERLHTFDDSRSFRAWWFAILRNCCIDLLRVDNGVYHERLDEVEGEHPCLAIEPLPDPENDLGEQLMWAIAQLTVDHQEILRLKYFADLSYKELAFTLGIPQGTVMSRLHLARIALAAKMKEQQ